MTEYHRQDPRMQALYGMYDDIIFKMALNELHDRELADIMASEMTESETAEMNAFFQEGEKRTLSVINRQFSFVRLQRFVQHTLPRVGIIVAVAVSLLTVGLVTAVATVPTVRAQVIQFIQRIEERYTELSVISDKLAAIDIPSEWEGEYYPFYMPIGYSVGCVIPSENCIFFRNSDDMGIRFYEIADEYTMHIDSEGAKKSAVSLELGQGDIYEEGDYLTLVLRTGDKCLVLHGEIPREEFIRMAISVKKIR